jgi:hypothetical protein
LEKRRGTSTHLTGPTSANSTMFGATSSLPSRLDPGLFRLDEVILVTHGHQTYASAPEFREKFRLIRLGAR